jgi:electron transport complex protein RnfA
MQPSWIAILFGGVIINNFVLAKFLGLCPFFGVSKRTSDALGMGLAVTFVMTMASLVTWALYQFFLLPQEISGHNLLAMGGVIGAETDLQWLKTITYILVIASLVQVVELVLKKAVPALYRALGIYLPLITTNCAVMGVVLLNTTDWMGGPENPLSLPLTLVQGLAAGVGFTLVMLLMSGVRERLARVDVPETMRDLPIAFICAGLMALAFMGFAGFGKVFGI